jgi:hypothetical protein
MNARAFLMRERYDGENREREVRYGAKGNTSKNAETNFLKVRISYQGRKNKSLHAVDMWFGFHVHVGVVIQSCF